MRVSIILIGLGLVLGLPTSGQALDPDVKCEAAKVKEAAKYSACRLKAESKAIKKAQTPDFLKCDSKYSEKWQKAESKAAGACPTESDEAAIQARMTDDADDIVTLLGGGTLAGCGDGIADPNANEQCDGLDLAGADCESLGYTLDGTLSCTVGCAYDTSLCQSQACPATGQTTASTADKNDGIGGAVAVPDDGTVQAGAVLSYIDNADGTITDLNTGLMWEKKGDNNSLHDVDSTYRWSGDGSQETIWDWLDDINTEGGTGFAGHADWRIPNYKELVSITDLERLSPAVDPVFDTACAPACTVTTCSCTDSGFYWSATSLAGFPVFAWFVNFLDGFGSNTGKNDSLFRVRAVRDAL